MPVARLLPRRVIVAYHVFRMCVPFQDAASLPMTVGAGTCRQGPGGAVAGGRHARPGPGTACCGCRSSTCTRARRSALPLPCPARPDVDTFDEPHAVAPRRAPVGLDARRLTLTPTARSVTVIGIPREPGQRL